MNIHTKPDLTAPQAMPDQNAPRTPAQSQASDRFSRMLQGKQAAPLADEHDPETACLPQAEPEAAEEDGAGGVARRGRRAMPDITPMLQRPGPDQPGLPGLAVGVNPDQTHPEAHAGQGKSPRGTLRLPVRGSQRQAAASQQSSEQQDPPEHATVQWISHVADKVAATCPPGRVPAGELELTIQLNPKVLPDTQLTVRASVSGIALRFATADTAVAALLSSHSTELAQRVSRRSRRPVEVAVNLARSGQESAS